MKVTVRTQEIEAMLPDIIPTFRKMGDALPIFLELEGLPTVKAEKEIKMREEFPVFWDRLTSLEWLLFVHLFEKKECSREELRTIMYGTVTGVNKRGVFEVSNVVDVHVKNLRKMLRHLGDEWYIETKRGWGYRLKKGSAPESARATGILKGQNRTNIKPREKKLNPDGSVHIYQRRKRGEGLNAIEFGYLKEMKMDDLTQEQVAERLAITDMSIIRRAWDAKSYDQFVGRKRKERAPRESRRPVECGFCGVEGHNIRTCPKI